MSIATHERATCLQTMLKDFKGVLVSDFYAAYDAIQCPQQKCLIHLIRDLNDDVLKHPFDEEMKQLARTFTRLAQAHGRNIDRYGLKSHFLKKHLPVCEADSIGESPTSNLQSETAVKFKERLEKNRDKLFTFLNMTASRGTTTTQSTPSNPSPSFGRSLEESPRKRASETTWFS